MCVVPAALALPTFTEALPVIATDDIQMCRNRAKTVTQDPTIQLPFCSLATSYMSAVTLTPDIQIYYKTTDEISLQLCSLTASCMSAAILTPVLRCTTKQQLEPAFNTALRQPHA